MWIFDFLFREKKLRKSTVGFTDWLAGWLDATSLYFCCTRHLFRCQHLTMVDSRHFFFFCYSRWRQPTKIDDEIGFQMNHAHEFFTPFNSTPLKLLVWCCCCCFFFFDLCEQLTDSWIFFCCWIKLEIYHVNVMLKVFSLCNTLFTTLSM